MRISELARQTGTTPRALRYYEEQGLLKPARLTSGYRSYDQQVVRTVQHIQLLLSAGLNTAAIAEILPCIPDDTTVLAPTCPELLDALAVERARITSSIDQLAAARAVLDRLLQPEQRLRFRAGHLPAVRDGRKRVTMRFKDPVRVGPALLVFASGDEVTLPGRITSTVAKPVDGITDEEAREDGFTRATDVLDGLRDYYPELQPSDEIVIVRFEVTAD